MIKDYRIYRFTWKEKIFCVFEGLFLNGIIAILFFNSFLALIPGMAVVMLYFKEKRRRLIKLRMHRLRSNLKEFLNAMISALQTGRSMENAFLEATKDTAEYLNEDTEFILEMKKINAGISVGEPLEKLLLDFSYRSHMEELEYFAEVFAIGKRSGGNLVSIMKNTIRMIQERMDAEEELYTVLAEKQMEFQLMSMIPMAMILYLRIGGGNLMNSLYGNLTGIVVMSVCLIVYGGCYLYGKRLLEING